MFLLSSFDGLRWYLGNDCVRASVAHDFYIDFSGKHMSTKSYQKYGRNGRTDAFLGLDPSEKECYLDGDFGFAEDKGN